MFTYVHVLTYVRVYLHVSIDIKARTQKSHTGVKCLCVYVCMYVGLLMYACMHVCMYACMHVHVHGTLVHTL